MGQLDLAKKKTAEAFDVSPDVAYRLIAALKEKRLPFIVAPYEADAQLAYLSRQGIVDIVITEDSDLLAFGARSVLYKFDYRDFCGEEIQLEKLCENRTPCLRDFTHCMFLTACIFSGCDYLNQVRGVGPTGAFNLISRNRNAKAALRELRSAAKQVPTDYEENFIKAFLTFRFQRVYCPRKKQCVMLNDVDIPSYVKQELAKIKQADMSFEEIQITEWADEILDQYLLEEVDNNPRNMSFVGQDYPAETIIKIAEGFIHPCTL